MFLLILRHAWLNHWNKHMTTGRINQVSSLANTRNGLLQSTVKYSVERRTSLKEGMSPPRQPMCSISHSFTATTIRFHIVNDTQNSPFTELEALENIRCTWLDGNGSCTKTGTTTNEENPRVEKTLAVNENYKHFANEIHMKQRNKRVYQKDNANGLITSQSRSWTSL